MDKKLNNDVEQLAKILENPNMNKGMELILAVYQLGQNDAQGLVSTN